MDIHLKILDMIINNRLFRDENNIL